MSDSDSYGKRASAPEYPEAQRAGEHLIIEASQWVPGQNPDPHQGHAGQQEYEEEFYRCIQCGVEVLDKGGLPEECDA